MLSKEEVADVISYCKEHGCSYKEHLAELGIPEWKFYDSKYKYAIRERKEFDKGRFLQLRTGSDGSMTPFPLFDSAKTGRKADKASRCTPQYSMLSIELQTDAGTMMRIQSMIYTTNWIERLQKDFRRVTRMRGAMPNEESVLVLMGKTAMDKSSYNRILPGITTDRTLFPSAGTNDALDENVVCVYHGMKENA